LRNIKIHILPLKIETSKTVEGSDDQEEEEEQIKSLKLGTSDFAWYTTNPTWGIESLDKVMESVGENMSF